MNTQLATIPEKPPESLEGKLAAAADASTVQFLRRGAKLWRKMERYYTDGKVFRIAEGCGNMAGIYEGMTSIFRDIEVEKVLKRELPTIFNK